MPKRQNTSGDVLPERPPASTLEGQEARMTAYAYDLVEKRLREGTASSQETMYWLKQGSQREKLEIEKLREENAMLKAKTKAIEAEKDKAEMYKEAIVAMQRYSAWITDG